MVKPLPKWLMFHYSKLWARFKSKKFYFSSVEKLLKVDNTSIVLSRLKKYGWLELSLDPKDSRKRLYKLVSPSNAVKEIVK